MNNVPISKMRKEKYIHFLNFPLLNLQCQRAVTYCGHRKKKESLSQVLTAVFGQKFCHSCFKDCNLAWFLTGSLKSQHNIERFQPHHHHQGFSDPKMSHLKVYDEIPYTKTRLSSPFVPIRSTKSSMRPRLKKRSHQ